MVQEKNAAQRRKDEMSEFLRRSSERLEKEIIGSRWYVYEYTPGYNTGGYYDQDIPAKSVRVSGYYPTREEAQEWMDRHEPNEGNSLRIGKQNKRRKVTIGWYDY